MKKGLKIFLNIISGFLVLITVILLLLPILLSSNSIQNYIVRVGSDIATETLGTPVKIESVKFNSIRDFQLNNIYVQDFIFNDTIIYAKKVNVNVGKFGILSPKIQFNNVSIEDGDFHLDQYKDSITNIKYVIEHLRNGKQPNKNKDTHLLFKNIELKDMRFRYKKYISKGNEFGIDYTNMFFDNIYANVKDFEVDNNVITFKVDKIKLNERNNVKLKNLSLDEAYISPDRMAFDNVNIEIDNSKVVVESFEMLYQNWNMVDFIHRIPINVKITESNIDFRDVAKFTTAKREWQSKAKFKGTFNGTVNDFSGEINYITTLNTEIKSNHYHVTGLPDINKTKFDVSVDKLTTNTVDIYNIINDFASKESISFAKTHKYNQVISVIGKFNGLLNNFKVKGNLNTFDGNGKGDFDFHFINDGESYIDGKANFDKFNFGEVLDIDDIGEVTAKIDFKGGISEKPDKLKSNIKIDKIDILDNNFSNILIAASISDNELMTDINCQDDKLNFLFNGYLNFKDNEPAYNAFININKASLYNLNLVKHDSLSTISSNLTFTGKGLSKNNFEVQARIDQLILSNSRKSIDSLSDINLNAYSNENIKNITINSDFIDLTLRGVANIDKIQEYVTQSIASYLPVFSGNNQIVAIDSIISGKKEINDYYVAQLNLKKETPFIDLIAPGLKLEEGAWIRFMFNPFLKTYSLNAEIPFISYKKNILSGVSLSSLNNGLDSMSTYIHAAEILYNNNYIPKASLISSVSKDNLSFSVGFDNSNNNSKLLFRTTGKVVRDKTNGKVTIESSILPSYYRFNSNQWNIFDGDIDFINGEIFIDSLEIESNNKYLSANGVLSKDSDKKLDIDINGFDISPISILLSQLGFTFTGNTTGNVQVISALDKNKRRIIGDIDIDNLSFNNSPLDDSKVILSWDKNERINRVELVSLKTKEKNATGYISWINNIYNFDFNFQEINPTVITPFLENIASEVDGSCSVNLGLSNNNKHKKLMMNGLIKANKVSAVIDFTKVRYEASGVMSVKENKFEMYNSTVRDSLGESGDLDVMLYLNPNKGFEFDIKIKPKNMLALNTTQTDNSMFYGKVFATGDVEIKNSNTGVMLTANVQTAKKSKFYLPLSYNSSISSADFIKYVVKEKNIDNDHLLWDMYKNKKSKKSLSDFDMRLNVDILPNAELAIVIDPISGSEITSTGNGNMSIIVNPNKDIFKINGLYTIDKGVYRFIMPNFNLVNKIFTIKEGGWIRFDGDPLNATLNVDAIYNVKASIAPLIESTTSDGGFAQRVEVECIMNIKNNLMKPDIELSVNVPNTDPETDAIVRSVLNTPEEASNQFIFLLITNSFMSSTSSSSGNFGLMGGVVTGIEFLTSRIKEIISSDKFDFGFNYLPKSGITSDEISLDVSAPIYKDVLFLDVKGNYNFKNNSAAIASTNMKSLSGEFYLTWVINESGNLRLKGFSRTIDTFDENQGLQESGVGIYYKEEFNNLKELIELYRKRAATRKKNRIAKREERKKRKEAKKVAKETLATNY